MVVTVVLSGVPPYVSLEDLAHGIDHHCLKSVVSFAARDLVLRSRSKKRLVALDFKTGFDAMFAQGVLDGYKYVLPDKEYVLTAKVTKDQDFLPDAGTVDRLTTARDYRSHRKQVERKHEALDDQIVTLQKQLNIVTQKTKLLKAKKNLKKIIKKRRRHSDSDSSDSEPRKKRKKRARSSRSIDCTNFPPLPGKHGSSSPSRKRYPKPSTSRRRSPPDHHSKRSPCRRHRPRSPHRSSREPSSRACNSTIVFVDRQMSALQSRPTAATITEIDDLDIWGQVDELAKAVQVLEDEGEAESGDSSPTADETNINIIINVVKKKTRSPDTELEQDKKYIEQIKVKTGKNKNSDKDIKKMPLPMIAIDEIKKEILPKEELREAMPIVENGITMKEEHVAVKADEDQDVIIVNVDKPHKIIAQNPKLVIPVTEILKEIRFKTNGIDENLIEKFFGIMRKILRIRIEDLLEGKPHMNLRSIVELYREHYDSEQDGELVANVVTAMKNGGFRDFVPSDNESYQPGRGGQHDFLPYISRRKYKKESDNNRNNIAEKNVEDVIDISDSEEVPNETLDMKYAIKIEPEVIDLNENEHSKEIPQFWSKVKIENVLSEADIHAKVKKASSVAENIEEVIIIDEDEDRVVVKTENDAVVSIKTEVDVDADTGDLSEQFKIMVDELSTSVKIEPNSDELSTSIKSETNSDKLHTSVKIEPDSDTCNETDTTKGKIPVDVQSRFEQQRGADKDELPTLSELLPSMEPACRRADNVNMGSPFSGSCVLQKEHVISGVSRGGGRRGSTHQQNALVVVAKSSPCMYCRKLGHEVAGCNRFIAQRVQRRRIIAKHRNLCYMCLGPHFVQQCDRTRACQFCGGRHHRVLCLKPFQKRQGHRDNDQSNTQAGGRGSPPREPQEHAFRSKANSRCGGPAEQEAAQVCFEEGSHRGAFSRVGVWEEERTLLDLGHREFLSRFGVREVERVPMNSAHRQVRVWEVEPSPVDSAHRGALSQLRVWEEERTLVDLGHRGVLSRFGVREEERVPMDSAYRQVRVWEVEPSPVDSAHRGALSQLEVWEVKRTSMDSRMDQVNRGEAGGYQWAGHP